MEINWKKFAASNSDTTTSFQSLSSYIFSQQTKTPLTNTPKNYPGLEAKPVTSPDGKTHGFQCKYFDVQDSKSQTSQLIKTLMAITVEDQKTIDTLRIFVNETASGVQTSVQIKLDKIRSKLGLSQINIEWIVGINSFQTILETNEDLIKVKNLFFSEGNILKLHSENVPQKTIENLFKAPHYLTLPLTKDGVRVSIGSLINRTPKILLLKSRAGAGKSKLLQYFTYRFSALDKSLALQQRNLLKKGAVIYFNAHEFVGKSVRDQIVLRLDGYKGTMGEFALNIVVDGLDEIAQKDAKIISQSFQLLIDTKSVDRLVISSREASRNALIFEQYLNPTTIHIEKLEDDQMLFYYDKKGNKTKSELLKSALKQKKDLEILRDVRMLELSWDITKSISDFDKTTIMEKGLAERISNTSCEDLNLLERKDDRIKDILSAQGYSLQKTEQYDFGLQALQELVEKQNPKLSYEDINNTIRVLKEVCIDEIDAGSTMMQFEHRSWADYLAAMELNKRFRQDKNAIVPFVLYEDFLKEWFIPVARSAAKIENDFAKSIVIGIFDYYLQDYLDRSTNDDQFLIRINISKNMPSLRETITDELRALTGTDFHDPHFTIGIYDAGYKDIAENFHRVTLRSLEGRNDDAYRLVVDNLLDFYRMQINLNNQSLEEIFERSQIIAYRRLQRGSYPVGSDGVNGQLHKIVSSLIDAGLSYEYVLKNIRPRMLKAMIEFLLQPQTVRTITNDPFLLNLIIDLYKGNTDYKLIVQGVYGESFSFNSAQKKLAKKYLDLSRKDHYSSFDQSYIYQGGIYAYKRILGYVESKDEALYEYSDHDILSTENIFEKIFYFTTRDVDFAQFKAFIKWLADAPIYNRTAGRNYEATLKGTISYVVAFLLQKLPYDYANSLMSTLKETDSSIISPYSLLRRLYEFDEERVRMLYTQEDVTKLINEARESSLEEYVSSIEDLAGILAIFHPEKANALILDLQRETRLRYGYHKDVLGFFLTDALELLWSKRLLGYEELKKKTEQVYRLIIGILDLSDGDEVHWLPNYFFDLLFKYDHVLAEDYYKKYRDDHGYDITLITLRLRAKISRGDPVDEIKKGVSEYRKEMMEPGRYYEAYFEQRFIVFTDIANNVDNYKLVERKQALKDAAEELGSLIRQENKKWKYSVSASYDSKLATSARIYNRLRKQFELEDQTSKFPIRRKDGSSNDDFMVKYNAQEKLNAQSTKQLLSEAQSASECVYLIKGITEAGMERKVSYNYLLANRAAAKTLVQKLHRYGVPFSTLRTLVARTIEPWSYGREASNFIDELWASPYRVDLREYLMSTAHHADTSTILNMLVDSKDDDLAVELINEVIDSLEVLVRKSSK